MTWTQVKEKDTSFNRKKRNGTLASIRFVRVMIYC